MIELEPRCKRELVALSLRLVSKGSLIEEGRFQSFGDRMIFVQKRGADRRLEGVMISDSSNKDRRFRVFAETGEFAFDPESGLLRLSLENGDLRIEPNLSDAFDAYRISFSRFDYDFPALQLGLGPLRYRIDELGLDGVAGRDPENRVGRSWTRSHLSQSADLFDPDSTDACHPILPAAFRPRRGPVGPARCHSQPFARHVVGAGAVWWLLRALRPRAGRRPGRVWLHPTWQSGRPMRFCWLSGSL